MIYLTLYLEFFKIGLFSVGGGLATLPFLQELVYKYGWITSEELLNMIAISESTPGPIGINTATFVGNTTAGVFGGVVATLGIITPSIIIIVIIAHFFNKFKNAQSVQRAFKAVRPAVSGLIVSVAYSVSKMTLLDIQSYKLSKRISDLIEIKNFILFAIIFILMRKTDKHPILYILIAGIIGIIFKY